MKKVPTVFERDWDGDRGRVVDRVHPGCEWVLAGEGVATRKLDGTCCLVRGGRLYRRHEVKPGGKAPEGFELADSDEQTGKAVGWVPVGDGPEDKWHRAAREAESEPVCGTLQDGTYELIGPHVQGNPEKVAFDQLVPHGQELMPGCPRDFAGLKAYLAVRDVEGVVFHHPDGRMAKVKLRDFGLKRNT